MISRWSSLRERYGEFIEDRDWERYHSPQNLAMAISVEANELLELFLWFNNPDSRRVADNDELVDQVREEVADVVIYCLSLAIQLDFDLQEAVAEKMEENDARFDSDRVEEINAELEKWQ